MYTVFWPLGKVHRESVSMRMNAKCDFGKGQVLDGSSGFPIPSIQANAIC